MNIVTKHKNFHIPIWEHSVLAKRAKQADQRIAARKIKPHKPLLNASTSDVVIGEIVSVLKTYSFTPFEFEGACRAGLRESFCLSGHAWDTADKEAARLVRAALNRIGAERPTWLEGQPEYLIGRENCQHCNGPLQKKDQVEGKRYCSHECAQFMRTHRSKYYTQTWEWSYLSAYYINAKKNAPERECAYCGNGFKSPKATVRFCSYSCSTKNHQGELSEIDCEVCGKRFKPRTRYIKNCSRECASEAYAKKADLRSCKICDQPFRPARANSVYCGDICRSKGRALDMRERRANRLPFVCDPK